MEYDPNLWDNKTLEKTYNKVGWTNNRLHTIQLMLTLEHETFLDVGCLDGAYINRARQEGYDKTYMGVDIAKRHVALASKNNPNEQFAIGDARKLEFDNLSFDIVMLSDVIQHLPDPIPPLKEICRIAKRYVILSTYGSNKPTYNDNSKTTYNVVYSKEDILSKIPSEFKCILFWDLDYPTVEKTGRKIHHYVLERIT